MKLTLALILAGILVLAGTAGESDANMGMPISQFLIQSAVGLGLLLGGVVRSRSYE